MQLKAARLESWQVFISESQERMVIAVEEKRPARAAKAGRHLRDRTDRTRQGRRLGILKVMHHGNTVCELDVSKLHEAPRASS
jgi:phosphoribosylformylglycinamidine (FGAM) synthase-like enzyme